MNNFDLPGDVTIDSDEDAWRYQVNVTFRVSITELHRIWSVLLKRHCVAEQDRGIAAAGARLPDQVRRHDSHPLRVRAAAAWQEG